MRKCIKNNLSIRIENATAKKTIKVCILILIILAMTMPTILGAARRAC